MDDKLLYNNDDEEIILTSVELVNSIKQDTKNEGYKEAENSSITLAHSNEFKLYCASKRKSHKKSSHKKKKKKKKKKHFDLVSKYPLQETWFEFAQQSFAEGYFMQQGQDIPSCMKFNSLNKSFFMFGKTENDLVGKDFNCDGHIAVFGGSGSGKSTGIAIPTLCTWKGPIFAFDFKGDLVKWAGRRNPKILYLLGNRDNQYYYDPFYVFRQDGDENLIQMARELAHAIIPLPHDIAEPFWIESAQNILTGAILYYYRLGDEFIDAMIEVKTTPMKELVSIISNDKMAKACINPDVVLDPKMLAGISMTLHNHIAVFATDTLIQDAFSSSGDNHKECIKWENLENRDIFIRIDQSKCEQWNSVMRLMVIQLIRTLERRPEKYESAGKRIAPTLLMLDEFPQYGKIDIFTSALKILRSKNVTISIFCQSLADLDEAYGKVTRCTILDNCPYKVILNASDLETQRYFSDLVGTIKTPSKGITVNLDDYGHQAGYSATINESREPIIFPYEFASLTDVILLHPYQERFCRLKKEMYFRQNPCPNLIKERR